MFRTHYRGKAIFSVNFIQSCEIADKMVHFSCDDTYACLYDLILNDTIRGPEPGLLLYIY